MLLTESDPFTSFLTKPADILNSFNFHAQFFLNVHMSKKNNLFIPKMFEVTENDIAIIFHFAHSQSGNEIG